MFPNLQAEQKKYKLTDRKVAKKMEISSIAYRLKKKNGHFVVAECKKLCQIFDADFEYLFSTEVINNSTA